MTEHRIEDDAALMTQLLVTMAQAARILHVGRTTVYGLVNDGALRTVHIGRSCRITRSELERYVARLDRGCEADRSDFDGDSEESRGGSAA